MKEKIQLINYYGRNNYEFKFNEITKINAFRSFNEFDLNIIDLRHAGLFILDDYNSDKLISDISSMYENINTAITNLKESKLMIILPNNFKIFSKSGYENKELKYRLKFFNDVIYNIINSYLNIKYECSITEIDKQIEIHSDFYMDMSKGAETIVLKSKGNNPVMIKKDNIYITTLDVSFNENLEILLRKIGLIEKENLDEPDWIKDFKFFDDDKQKEKILNSESLIKKEEEKIKNAREILQINSRYKSILYTQGEKLVDVVKDIISEMLDIDLSGFIDKKKEDIRFEYNNDVFIGEIKGIADNVKSKNLSQLDNHFTAFVDENPNIDEEKIFKLLIINSQRELPLDKRDSIDNKQIAQAEKKYKSLIIETKTLLKLFEDYKNQKINREEIIEKLKTYGILKL
ncbi:hypothetical protein [uncultured Parvimonas sp.]|uniref:hypothetical protein n=1 Tax=uncultured Parvimonas sp. TaxID=747372 RepID=UPI0028D0D1A9|nr:hypothetical protein [uncultured Parvimonas sp.]